MKSILLTYKEYSQVYKEFGIKKLKSIYIEKYSKETENEDPLIKNENNGEEFEWNHME